MTREFAMLRCSMSDDPDFNDLTPDAQLVYFRLTIRPQLSMVGITPTAPGVIAAQTGLNPDRIGAALAELETARFVVTDTDTAELLVRAKLRCSGYGNVKHASGARDDASRILSVPILRVVVAEAARLGWDWTDLLPDLPDEPPSTARVSASPQVDSHSDRNSDSHSGSLSDRDLSDVCSLMSESLTSESEKIGRDPDPPPDLDRIDADFADAWRLYPRKVDRGAAAKAYRALRRRRPNITAAQLTDAVGHYATAMATQARAPTKIKHGATFFGPGDPWAEYLDGDAEAPTRPSATSPTAPPPDRQRARYLAGVTAIDTVDLPPLTTRPGLTR